MIFELQAGRVSIVDDEATAAYAGVRRETTLPTVSPTPTQPHCTRMVLELMIFAGGMLPRALLGGRFIPGHGGGVTISMQTTEDDPDQPATCRSMLGSALLPGLPAEYADGVLLGIRSPVRLPPGSLVLDRAAHDLVESSARAFSICSTLLLAAFAAELEGQDVEEAVLAESRRR